jgi:protein arginine kinase
MAADERRTARLRAGVADADGPHADIVLSTRIRLARNLQSFRFGLRADDETGSDAARLTLAAAAERTSPSLAAGRAGRCGAGADVTASAAGAAPGQQGAGRRGRGEPPAYTALLLAPDEALGVMVNEEDHLRLQSLVSGFRLREAWRRGGPARRGAGPRLRYAFHPSSATSPPARPTWGRGCAPRC